MLFDPEVAKRVFGYPAGKVLMREGLVKMISPHRVYVEPFCGAASVFFAKERSDKEVLSDTNEDVISAYKSIQALTDKEAEALRGFNWKGSRETFAKVLRKKPKSNPDRLYKFLYLTVFSHMKGRKNFSADREGVVSKIAERAIKARDRLRDVTIKASDYRQIIKDFDGKDTFFFLDPPYPGYNAGVGEKKFDEKEFVETLKSIKGRFVCTYGTKGKADFSDKAFRVQRVDTRRTLANSEGVGREKLLSQLVVSNFDAPTYKAFETGPAEVFEPRSVETISVVKSEGGSHTHFLDRRAKETADDGQHMHLFAVKDGERQRIFGTMFDGPHQHKLSKDTAEETRMDGAHTHKIRMFMPGELGEPDGSFTLTTESAPGHSHKLLVERTAGDGLHQHDLRLPNGETIRSLSPGEAFAMRKAETFDIPIGDDLRIASMKMRVVKDAATKLDLWIERGNDALCWSLDAQAFPLPLNKSRFVADSFSVEGSRYLKPLSRYVDAECIGTCDPGILKYDGEAEGGEILHVDAARVEYGLQTELTHEYFLSKGDELCGVLEVSRNFVECWQARIRKSDLLPLVLSEYAVAGHIMPPDGLSALPDSIEKMIPPELRYWERRGEDARETRDALVASKMIKADSLALVNGEIRIIEKELSLFSLPEQEDLQADWQISALRKHSPVEIEERFELADLDPGSSAVFVDLCDADLVSGAIAQLKNSDREFAISCEDGEASRGELSKHGRPFRFVPKDPRNALEVTKRLFLASFPLTQIDDVEWISVPKEASPVESTALEDEIAKLTDEITIAEIGKAEDERFVMGVVLEPETTDSQGDIYSADVIRQTAHNFMAKFQNIGLQHKKIVNGKVLILESFLAPSEMKIGKAAVKKGTWILAVRVTDDQMWLAVKKGDLTGFSIGGSAVRAPLSN